MDTITKIVVINKEDFTKKCAEVCAELTDKGTGFANILLYSLVSATLVSALFGKDEDNVDTVEIDKDTFMKKSAEAMSELSNDAEEKGNKNASMAILLTGGLISVKVLSKLFRDKNTNEEADAE